MKILLLQDYLRSGGTERQTVLLANGFAAEEHDTTLLTFRPGGPLAGTVSPAVHHHTLQPFDLGLDWFAPGLLRFVRRTKPDVVMCMGRMANCHGYRVLALREAGRRTDQAVATCVVGTMRTGKPLPARFQRTLRRVDHIVANSCDARDTLVSAYAVVTHRISVIYNALVFPPLDSLRRNETLRAQLGATPATTVLLNVAMFRPEKNQRELIELASRFPATFEWQLWFAGDGPERAACEQFVAEKKLGARIKFLGFQSNPSALYCAADLAVHASWSEALSNFLIEAQAHGLPAVAYMAQGIEECFRAGRTGWAIPRDDRALFVNAIEQLAIMAPRDRQAISSEARDFARMTFHPRRQIDSYLKLFERLL